VGQRQVDSRSAAGRAALADPQAAPPPPPTPLPGGGPSARRRPLRLLLVAVAALVVLVAGAVGTYVWALGHWFVGVDSGGTTDEVAVFRGLNVSIVGFDLYRVDRDTGLPLIDLTPAARSRVNGGITADDRSDADRILSALRDQRLPVCPSESRATPTPTPTPAPAQPVVPAPVPAQPTPGAPLTTEPGPDGFPSPTTSARTTASSEPGVDCREAD
jgi:protein phosphatase